MNFQLRTGFVPIIILLVAVFGLTAVSSGAVYWVKQKGKKPIVPTKPQPTLNTNRALTPTIEKTAERFDGSASAKPSFTIQPPQGWVRPADIQATSDFHFAAPDPDFINKSEGYFSNLVAQTGPHQTGYASMKDYQKNYRFEFLRVYPKSEILQEGAKTINGYQAYYIESLTPDDKGVKLHRLQYLFFIDSNFALGALGSTLESAWGRDGGKIKASIESIKIETLAAPTATATTPQPVQTFLPEYQPGEKPY